MREHGRFVKKIGEIIENKTKFLKEKNEYGYELDCFYLHRISI